MNDLVTEPKKICLRGEARTPAQRSADARRARAMIGNQHGRRAKMWRDALRRQLYRRDADGHRMIDAIARETVRAAALSIEHVDRDVAAVVAQARRDIGDRLDGRPTQSTELSGANGAPIQVQIGPRDADVL